MTEPQMAPESKPAPAQPVSGLFVVDIEKVSDYFADHMPECFWKEIATSPARAISMLKTAEAYSMQQNATLREELEHERANVEMLASKIAFDNQAAEAELAKARSRQPNGYAYRYPDNSVRFTDGRSVNGSDPILAIPYYFDTPMPRKLPSAEVVRLAKILTSENGPRWEAGCTCVWCKLRDALAALQEEGE